VCPGMTESGLSGSLVVTVIGAGVLHATWNAIAKHLDDGLMVFALIGVASTVGGGIGLAVTGLPYRAAIPFVALSAAIHLAYDLALMSSYRIGAFNQTYPIARGMSPLVVAVGAYFLANEHLSALALCGIATLTVGLISLAFSTGRMTRAEMPAVGAAVLTGLTIAAYTLVDGLGVRRAHDPYAYAALLFLLQGPVFPLVAVFLRPANTWKDLPNIGRGLGAGALSLIAYGTVLWAQTRGPLAEIAALRETSVISAALIGALFMKEPFGARRFAAAVCVAAGIILIAI
jgi:drug/metabolite transporter (DMT)-like permease